MLIITAPFCYLYYKSHKRDATQETQKLRESKIDESLKSKVENYKKELEDYKQESEQSKHHDKDINDLQYDAAIRAYDKGEYVNFNFAIKNSINWHNDKAVLFLLEKYKENRIGDVKEEMYEKVRINLLLFSSYLGNKQSANELADIFDHPKIKQDFLKKSQS